MAVEFELPKGPSNSAKMGATPGTQQTAINNVNSGGGFNPNMPIAKQAAEQSRSSFQKGLMGGMPTPRPAPATTRPQARRPQQQQARPIVSRGMPMDQGRGYNVFSGMDGSQISEMNQSMGMSNMTSLPSLNPGLTGLANAPGQPTLNNLVPMDTEYTDPEGGEHYWNNNNTVTVTKNGSSVTYDLEDYVETYDGDPDNYLAGGYIEDHIANENAKEAEEATADSLTTDTLTDILNSNPGLDSKKMAEVISLLDSKYAGQLQALMMGIDRQAAMMGTMGSGAHSMSINNATAQALTAMADEYKQLGLADLTQHSVDLQQTIINKLSIVDRLLAADDFTDENNVEELLNLEKFLSESNEGPVSDYISVELSALAPNGYHAFYTPLAQMSDVIFKDLSDGILSETEAIQKYKKLSGQYMAALTSWASNAGLYQTGGTLEDATGFKTAAEAEVQALFDQFFADAGITSDLTVSY